MYDKLKYEILEKTYFYEKQNGSLVYIFMKNKNVYKRLCQEGEISKEAIDLFNKYDQKFIEIYEKMISNILDKLDLNK